MAAKQCDVSFRRARRDYEALDLAIAKLNRAKGRLHSIGLYNPNRAAFDSRTKNKAYAAIKSAADEVKIAGVRWERSSKAYNRCTRSR